MVETDHTQRQAVRVRLFDRLDEAGLARPRRLTAEAFDRQKVRLLDRLDHMSGENLDTLAELVIDAADGKRPEWPSEKVILFLANSLQPRPFEQLRIVTSWLASIEGPTALAGGWLVELYRFLRRTGRPPSNFDEGNIRAEAAENRRKLVMISERRSRGAASASDLDWAEAWERDRAAAEAIVTRGEAKRCDVRAAE